jgi:hypothetical protein
MRRIPDSIKSEIIEKFLEGYSTTANSKQLNVSVGTVSAVTKEECRKNEFYLYIHEIAKKFRSKNLEISDVISGVRLYNKIKKVGLTCSFFENFLDATNTESFRLNKDHSEFLEDIKKIVRYEKLYRIKIEKIPGYMVDKIKYIKKLKEETKELLEENTRLYLQNNIEKSEIKEYLEEKLSFWQYKRNKNYPRYPEWFANPYLFEVASKKIGTKIEPRILYKKLKLVYVFPNEYTSIVKKIMSIDDEYDLDMITKK